MDWNGSPYWKDPDNFWVDDETGELVDAATGQRFSASTVEPEPVKEN